MVFLMYELLSLAVLTFLAPPPASSYTVCLMQCLINENEKVRRDICGCAELNPALDMVTKYSQ